MAGCVLLNVDDKKLMRDRGRGALHSNLDLVEGERELLEEIISFRLLFRCCEVPANNTAQRTETNRRSIHDTHDQLFVNCVVMRGL